MASSARERISRSVCSGLGMTTPGRVAGIIEQVMDVVGSVHPCSKPVIEKPRAAGSSCAAGPKRNHPGGHVGPDRAADRFQVRVSERHLDENDDVCQGEQQPVPGGLLRGCIAVVLGKFRDDHAARPLRQYRLVVIGPGASRAARQYRQWCAVGSHRALDRGAANPLGSACDHPVAFSGEVGRESGRGDRACERRVR